MALARLAADNQPTVPHLVMPQVCDLAQAQSAVQYHQQQGPVPGIFCDSAANKRFTSSTVKTRRERRRRGMGLSSSQGLGNW